MQSYGRIVEKHKNRLLSNNAGHYLLLIATTHFSPNSPTFEKKFAKSAFFSKFNNTLPRTIQSYERIVEKHKNRLLCNNTGQYLLLIATTHFSPNSPTFEKKFAKSSFFRKFNKILPRTMQSYERIVEKHKNRLLRNNAGHYLLLIATTHFSPNSPTFEKKFAKSAFFRKFNNILPRTMQSYERIVEKHKNRLLCNNTGHYLLLIATTHFSPNSPTFEKIIRKVQHFFVNLIRSYQEQCNLMSESLKNTKIYPLSNNTGHYLLLIATTHFSPNSPTFEKKIAKSAFFRKFNKILPRTMQSYERIVEKHKNRFLSNNTGHYLLLIATTHFSPNSPTFEKKSAKSSFFRKFNKILPRTMQSYERIVEKHKNRLLGNNAGHYLLLIATTHFSPNSPTFEKKFAKSAFFSKFNNILPRTMQSYERIVEKHKNRLLCNNTGHYLLLIATTHFSPNSPTFEKKFAKCAFFRKFNKILPRTMQSYERIVEKHKNLFLSNNTENHLLLFATTHFSPNSPTFEKQSAKSAFFRKFNKILPRTMQSYERIVEKHKNRLLGNNTGHYLLLIVTTHFSPNSPTFEKKFAKSAFFRKFNKILQEQCNLMSESLKYTKVDSCATIQDILYFYSPPPISPQIVPHLRKNSQSQHFFVNLIRSYQEQ